MILQFPDHDTLRLALTSGVVSAEVSVAPAVGGVDEAGRPWLDATVDAATAKKLARLGVTQPAARPGASEELHNWLQALPLVRDEKSAEIGNGREVIFELPEATRLPEVVGEMLRLSVDRQSFRWLDSGGVLLRVIGPPYYTLLRAIDRDAASGVRAYVERAARVWVEIGHTHPLVGSISPPEGQALFLRPPRDWLTVAEAPFRDIYEILDFKLPRAKLDWEPAELRKKLIVPLRLVEGDRHDPELWVLRDDPVARLDALVRDAREGLVQRLIFAVGEHEGKPVVVLRVRPSKQPPPQLIIEAEAYCPYLKLDNLFVPVGTRIHPVLRRDAVRKLLADDPEQINWLRNDSNRRGGFVPERLPDDAFRSLSDWVEYVLDRDRQALSHWVEEFKFDFDPFVCPEEEAPRPRAPARRRAPAASGFEPREPRLVKVAPAPKPAEPAPPPERVEEIAAAPPSQLQIELTQLQERFIALEGPLDDPVRLRLWPEMAARHAALKHSADAGLCWMNLLWELLNLDAERADLEREPSERRAARQARLSELRKLADEFGGDSALAGRWLRGEGVVADSRLTGADLDRLLENEQPAYSEVRGLVACLVWAAYDPAAAKAIVARLPRVQQYLERHERTMGLRPVWLAWGALAKITRDPLALARARDRLIERLVTEGYSAERDLPGFLRAAGHHDRERVNVIRERFGALYELARKWCEESRVRDDLPGTIWQTSGQYVDVIFAFGFARLNEPTQARERVRDAEAAIKRHRGRRGPTDENVGEIHGLLVRGFRYRVEQVLQGRPHAGPLPAEWRDDLEKAVGRTLSRYFVDRMRQQSQILEPEERFDPQRDSTKPTAELEQRLIELSAIRDPTQLHATIRDLFKVGAGRPPAPEEQLNILTESLMLAPRVGDALVQDLLARIEPVLDRLTSYRSSEESRSSGLLERQAIVLERGMVIAANYGRGDLVQRLWPRLIQILQHLQQEKRAAPLVNLVNRVFSQSLRSMRKLGLRDEIGKLIDQADRLVRKGRSLTALEVAAGKDWPITLTTLVYLAGGWLSFGWLDKSLEVLDAARKLLLSERDKDYARTGLFPQLYANLAVAYVTALGEAPVDAALRRIEEFFRRAWRLEDTFTSSTFYSRMHLNIIEAVVLAVVSEEFATGPSARRWMDDDEYLIRRRIHRDHRVAVAMT
jgi:hypothetical protein